MISALIGQSEPASALIDMGKLVSAYYTDVPDPVIAAQRVAFGTSGHRGSAFDHSLNACHVLAITPAICHYRKAHGIGGPLFMAPGQAAVQHVDTHALSAPACASALEVLSANGVDVMLALSDEFTPTPALSHAILSHNCGRGPSDTGLADGIVVTPSHNPPRGGGFKYNPSHGGPASQAITSWIEAEANRLLEARLDRVKRMAHAKALQTATTHRHEFLQAYVADLGNVIDMDVIREAKVRMGVDPLGGAGVHHWGAIAERHHLDLTVISEIVDPNFGFMPLDWDSKIRIDPSSPYAMQRLVDIKSRFNIAFACDTDHDRHGIVTPSAGLLSPDHCLAAAIDCLFQNRPDWSQQSAIGKTVVSSRLINHTARGGFAAWPSGTEDTYKIYAERFVGPEHLQRILHEAQAIVDAAISPAPSSSIH